VKLQFAISLKQLQTSMWKSMGCEAQLAWKCQFTPTVSAHDFDRWSRSDWPNSWCTTRVSLL